MLQCSKLRIFPSSTVDPRLIEAIAADASRPYLFKDVYISSVNGSEGRLLPADIW